MKSYITIRYEHMVFIIIIMAMLHKLIHMCNVSCTCGKQLEMAYLTMVLEIWIGNAPIK